MPGKPGEVAGGLFAPIVTTDALIDATSDRAWVQAMLDTEAALARVEESLGIIPAGTAAAIAAECTADAFDADALGRGARLGGNAVIPLVAELRERAGPPAGDWVHFGATSQDIVDTASMLIAKRTSAIVEAELVALCSAAAGLCERHRSDLMVGRTLLQHALPITFGLKAAGWLTAANSGRTALKG
ncbi:MAG: lyase family protein, partial [Acidimicrobiales bacterium]